MGFSPPPPRLGVNVLLKATVDRVGERSDRCATACGSTPFGDERATSRSRSLALSKKCEKLFLLQIDSDYISPKKCYETLLFPIFHNKPNALLKTVLIADKTTYQRTT